MIAVDIGRTGDELGLVPFFLAIIVGDSRRLDSRILINKEGKRK